MKCEDIQEILFDYMTRELGSNRSELVGKHLRKCEKCRAAAADIRATLDLLRAVTEKETDLPAHLSEDRRARIWRALMHPVISWIEIHHIFVSIIVALVVLVLVAMAVRHVQLWRRVETDPGIPVTIGNGPPE